MSIDLNISDTDFAAEYLKIQNRQGQLVSFLHNRQQQRLVEAVDEQRAEGKPVRLRILKYRRGGLSTGIAGLLFKATVFQGGQNTLVLAHEKAAARNLFSMYDRFQQHFPEDGRLALPLLSSRNAGEESGSLRWANDSTIQISTAKNTDFSRSFNFRRLHLSERAFYRDIRTLTAALAATVPEDPDTWIIEETTANSYNEFYNDWIASMEGKTSYKPLFLGCFEDPDNSRALDQPPDRFQETLTNEEWELKQRYSLALEQVYWRRRKIEDDYRGDELLFDQEYPHSWEVAFLVSGRPRFNPKFFMRMPVTEGAQGKLTVEDYGTRQLTRFYQQKGAELTIWKQPSKLDHYVGGADPSKGIDANEGSGKADPDYSTAHIYNQATAEQVAKLRERIPPPQFAQYLYDLGKYYNWVYWVIEVETNGGNGAAVINELIRLGYPTARLYRHKDPRSGKESDRYGYEITGLSRQNLIADWERLLSQGVPIIHDANTISEHRTFVIKSNGQSVRIEHQAGCHDDDVFGSMYAGIGLLHAPKHHTEPLPKFQPVDGAVALYSPTSREQAATLFNPNAAINNGRDVPRWKDKM